MTITAHGITATLGMGLAPRELQCLISVAAGLTSKEAARELGVAPDTINKRILSATTKLGVTRRTALVAKAFALGLIQLGTTTTPDPHHQQRQDPHAGVLIA